MFHDLFSDLLSPRRATRVTPNLHDRNGFFMIVTNRYVIIDSLIVDLGIKLILSKWIMEKMILESMIQNSRSTVTGGRCDWAARCDCRGPVTGAARDAARFRLTCLEKLRYSFCHEYKEHARRINVNCD